jgi:hypothetical protein
MSKNAVAVMMLICAVLFGASSAVAAEKDCRLKRYASFNLASDPDGRLLVPVAINGTPAFMILSLASGYSSVTEDAVTQFNLQTRPIPTGMQVREGHETLHKLVNLKGFSLAGLPFGSVEFLMIRDDNLDSGTSGAPVIGVLGMDALATFDVELDAANRKMGVFSQDHCAGHAVYWSKEFDSVPIRLGGLGEFYFPMELDGKKLETTFATNRAMTTLSTDVTKRLYNFDEHSPDIETKTDAIGQKTYHYRAMKLKGEGLDIINAQIRLVDGPTLNCHLTGRLGAAGYEGCYGVHPLKLGLDVLTKLHIYIATKEKVLYFTSSGG